MNRRCISILLLINWSTPSLIEFDFWLKRWCCWLSSKSLLTQQSIWSKSLILPKEEASQVPCRNWMPTSRLPLQGVHQRLSTHVMLKSMLTLWNLCTCHPLHWLRLPSVGISFGSSWFHHQRCQHCSCALTELPTTNLHHFMRSMWGPPWLLIESPPRNPRSFNFTFIFLVSLAFPSTLCNKPTCTIILPLCFMI